MFLRMSLLITVAYAGFACAAELNTSHPGYRLILDKAFVPPGWNQETFDNTYRVWPKPLREKAEKATKSQRRQMAFTRYGLTRRPGAQNDKPLQFVVDDQGNWSANCFTCHGGKVVGKTWPGLPNSHYALQTLSEEILLTKRLLNQPFTQDDIGALLIPLGTTHGTTNAVAFGIALGSRRDPELNLLRSPTLEKIIHHDMDAPPWWHFKKRDYIYIDGFAKKSHRALMQFALNTKNGPERFREWEADFRKIYEWMETVQPPTYPFAIDRTLANEGRAVFSSNCSSCHGTYGKDGQYPQRFVKLSGLATDSVRFEAISTKHRVDYEKSWFAYNGKHRVKQTAPGYVAPPLDGIWASAPYFHNGSVPTLDDVLHPETRPSIWRRTPDGYDKKRVGLEYRRYDKAPSANDRWQNRAYFDSSKFGKSNRGHDYPSRLSESEKKAVLEYLKTL